MQPEGKVVVVTGGGSGIGAAMCEAFAAAGAETVAVLDLNGETAGAVAERVGGTAHAVDVADGVAYGALLTRITEEHGRIDVLCSNAGVGYGDGPGHAADADDSIWDTCWRVNVMAQVWGARAVLPGMLARGDGYLINTASAAGLLSQIGDAAYSTTKHASVGFSESLAISHGDQGIGVSVLCPQYVETKLLEPLREMGMLASENVISPESVAQATLAAMRERRFLILPHPEVEGFFQAKAGNYERWVGGMRKLRRGLLAAHDSD